MQLTFLGAVTTVTGSKYLLETADARILVDCGLFQGYKQLRRRNWRPLPVEPSSIDAVVLTHAHIDHSGYIPLLVRNGFEGPVISTAATADLCSILLPDSGFLQEKDAEFANRHGFSKHKPAKPLYTKADAERSLDRFAPIDFDRPHALPGGAELTFLRAGHILGAAMARIEGEGARILFTGDLGRPGAATMHDPERVRSADYLVCESTYGDRLHDRGDPEDALADVIVRTVKRGGTVLIPAFAVGRTQTLLYHLYRLKQDGRIPRDLPIYLDSPMAINASETFCRHVPDHRLGAEECRAACNVADYTREVEESKALDADPMPKVIVSASGMATGGRVLHHLKVYAPDPRSAILFTGFQAGGTRGAAMERGVERIKIHGDYYPVKAEVDNLHMLSAHADADEIMGWLGGFDSAPRMTYVTHGEAEASDTLRHRIQDELGWPCEVPDYCDRVDLT